MREDRELRSDIYASDASRLLSVTARRAGGRLTFSLAGAHENLRVVLKNATGFARATGAALTIDGGDTVLAIEDGVREVEVC
jgi:hypothetical protein